MKNIPISLRKVLEATLDRPLARRYLRATITDEMPARYFYNAALRDLSAKDSDSGIHHLILALDIEPDHAPSLHLARTMLFGLSKKFRDEGGDFYKQRYPNLAQWIKTLDQRIQQDTARSLSVRNQIKKLPQGGLARWLEMLLSPSHRKQLEKELQTLEQAIAEQKKELKFASKMAQIEEYAKVLSQILEIALYPSRYTWVMAAVPHMTPEGSWQA